MIGLENRSSAWSTARKTRKETRKESRESGRQRPGGALLPLRAVLFGLAVPLLLRRRLEDLAAWLETATDATGAAGREDQNDLKNQETAGEMVRRIDGALRAAWPLVRRGCLTRGFTRFWFLRRAGFPVSLRFGMGEIDGRIEGHCWLVLDGAPFAEPRDPRPLYTETWRIPRDSRPAGSVLPLGQSPE